MEASGDSSGLLRRKGSSQRRAWISGVLLNRKKIMVANATKPDRFFWNATSFYRKVARSQAEWQYGPGRAGIRRQATKFQRYRAAQHKRGMKLLRIWVPDSRRPEFAAEAAREAGLLRGRPEELGVLAFIEAAFEWPDV